MSKINLSKDRPVDEQVHELLSTIAPDSAEMAELDLSRNHVGRIPQTELMKMSNAIKCYPVQSINLTLTGLQLKTGKELAEFIDSFKDSTITSFDLTGNLLGVARTDENIILLAHTLRHSSLKWLNLSHNNLGRLKLDVLKDFLFMLNHSSLERIQLDANEFDRLGGPHFIAEFFAKNLGKKIVLEHSDSFTTQINDHLSNVFVSAHSTLSP